METLIDLIAKAAEDYGEKTALVLRSGLRDTTWSYRQLWTATRTVARHLSEAQCIQPGARLLLCAPNSPQYVATFLGTMLAGAIPVPLDLASTADFVARVANDTAAVALITDRATGINNLPCLPLAGLPFTGDEWEFDSRPQAGDIAEIVYTSGTTGKPKGVVLSQTNITADVRSATARVPASDTWRLLSLLPLSHMFEQTVGLFGPLMGGATIHYGVSRQSAAIRRALLRYRINVLVAVPMFLTHMLQGIEREVRHSGRWAAWQRANRLSASLPIPLRRLLFRSVRRQLGGSLDVIICGGAWLPPELERAWERLGVNVVQGYGTSECAPLVACNTLARRRLGTVGIPSADIQVRLAWDGEIQVHGGNVFVGYWNNEAATREAFTADGWYRTGDLGSWDREGNLIIKGRMRDMVVLASGMNVFLEDIEGVLRRQPGMHGSVVVDLTRTNGEIGFTAAVLLSADTKDLAMAQAAAEAAVREANLQLSPHERITGVALWQGEDFPRTAIGKIKRHEVRARLAATVQARAEEKDRARADRAAEITHLQRLLGELSGRDPASIGPDSDLTLDLGLGSLARVELALLLEEQFGVLVDDGDIAGVEKVAQLAMLLGKGGTPTPTAEIPLWPLGTVARRLRPLLQHLVLFPVHRLIATPFKVEGLENLHDLEPPALFIANHASHVDTAAIIRSLPSDIRNRLAVAAAADYFFRYSVVGNLTSLVLNTFPFSREGAVRTSLEHCGRLADEGWSVLVYPEGTRATAPGLLPFKSGVGLLAAELRVPVVPLAVSGGLYILPKGRAMPRRGPMQVRFGVPLRFTGRPDPTATAAMLQERVAELLVASFHPGDMPHGKDKP